MAKRKRARGTLGHITGIELFKLEDRLNRIASTEFKLKSQGKRGESRRQFDRMVGAMSAADALGAKCTCFLTAMNVRQCVCSKNIQEMRKRANERKAAHKRYKARGVRFV